jgi:hypothetical protein
MLLEITVYFLGKNKKNLTQPPFGNMAGLGLI